MQLRLLRRMQPNALLRRGLWLEYATLGWNVIGTVVTLIAAVTTGSAALAGFGLDSAIEIFASVVVVWQLKGIGQGRESLALKLIGAAFFALAIYVLLQSGWTLDKRASRALRARNWLARGDMRRHAAAGVGKADNGPSAWQRRPHYGSPRHSD